MQKFFNKKLANEIQIFQLIRFALKKKLHEKSSLTNQILRLNFPSIKLFLKKCLQSLSFIQNMEVMKIFDRNLKLKTILKKVERY